jgi:acyl-coenzyme A synthetase/AMP-(fatty) acid ligase
MLNKIAKIHTLPKTKTKKIQNVFFEKNGEKLKKQFG